MTTREQKARAADEARQERGNDSPVHDIGVQSPGYVHATHPDHGAEVVFIEGELLPQWVVDKMRESGAKPDQHNVYRLG